MFMFVCVLGISEAQSSQQITAIIYTFLSWPMLAHTHTQTQTPTHAHTHLHTNTHTHIFQGFFRIEMCDVISGEKLSLHGEMLVWGVGGWVGDHTDDSRLFCSVYSLDLSFFFKYNFWLIDKHRHFSWFGVSDDPAQILYRDNHPSGCTPVGLWIENQTCFCSCQISRLDDFEVRLQIFDLKCWLQFIKQKTVRSTERGEKRREEFKKKKISTHLFWILFHRLTHTSWRN